MTVAPLRPYEPSYEWPEPQPIPADLLPVAPFDDRLLPEVLKSWVMDIAERMQCPPDYVAVSSMVAASAVVGRKVAIRPQRRTDWAEVPNLWGMIVGRPGVMKTPAMNAALSPIKRLDVAASEANEAARAEYNTAKEEHALRMAALKSAAKLAIKNGKEAKLDGIGAPGPDEPPLRRFTVNDATYEALGEVLIQNPNGVLFYRDELISMLQPLSREENSPARGFFLSAWNGTDSYTFDRIGRGHKYIPACCVSILGATQPAKLTGYLHDALKGKAGDDGFAQRFQMLVWPDVAREWEDVDRYPDTEARHAVNAVFDRLNETDPVAMGARVDDHDPLPYLRFTDEAVEIFLPWRTALETRIRGNGLHRAMESHLAKYRGLAPKLALLLHLIQGNHGPVGAYPLTQALAWVEYLETHAARAYGSAATAEATSAERIMQKVRDGDLPSPFTARNITQSGWSGLTDKDDVAKALNLLCEHDWLRHETLVTGGAPKHIYIPNPRGMQ